MSQAFRGLERFRRALLAAAVLLAAACGETPVAPDDPAEEEPGPVPPPGLRILLVTPGAGAGAVETGVTVEVVFNQPIDPATLTAATFSVSAGAAPLPTVIGYDPATMTARAAAPFLSDSGYTVALTPGVRTPADSALAASETWSFTTRRWEAVTVDQTGFVGPYARLVVDADGRPHATYYDQDNGDLKYATCSTGCGSAGAWQTVAVDTAGSVGIHTSLALGPDGRLHVSYRDFTAFDLKYATCVADCETAANWQTTLVDSAGSVGNHSSVAADATGRVHIIYHASSGSDLKYATCGGNCGQMASWQTLVVDATGLVGPHGALALDDAGRIHVSYYDDTNDDLKYASCASGCTAAAGWQTVTVSALGNVGQYTSIAAQPDGRLHVGYYDVTNGDLRYATCATGCTAAAAWQTAAIDTTGDTGTYTSLTVDRAGRLHLAYHDVTNADLRYATCAAACSAPAFWRMTTVDAGGDVGEHASVAVDRTGGVHFGYRYDTTDDFKYVR